MSDCCARQPFNKLDCSFATQNLCFESKMIHHAPVCAMRCRICSLLTLGSGVSGYSLMTRSGAMMAWCNAKMERPPLMPGRSNGLRQNARNRNAASSEWLTAQRKLKTVPAPFCISAIICNRVRQCDGPDGASRGLPGNQDGSRCQVLAEGTQCRQAMTISFQP